MPRATPPRAVVVCLGFFCVVAMTAVVMPHLSPQDGCYRVELALFPPSITNERAADESCSMSKRESAADSPTRSETQIETGKALPDAPRRSTKRDGDAPEGVTGKPDKMERGRQPGTVGRQ